MIRIEQGDCLDVMRAMIDEGVTVDSCVTDPPYGLAFMGNAWDNGVPGVEFWRLVYDLLKPGAHLAAFSGTRTYHRMACAIEDAGFEIRDQLAWVYGSGFPKSHDVSKAIDKAAGVEFDARPASGVGFMGPDGPGGYNVTKNQLHRVGGMTTEALAWQGWGTALKPSHEPICLARKPLIGTVASNVLQHGTGAINVDGCRVEGAMDGVWGTSNKTTNPERMFNGSSDKSGYRTQPHAQGRWPANLIHDGSDEVLEGLGEANRFFYCAKASKKDRINQCSTCEAWGIGKRPECGHDTLAPGHPTVKPVALMRWLTRLITPPGGMVIDPFAGTGSTGVAALMEGSPCTLIEREGGYVAGIKARIALMEGEM